MTDFDRLFPDNRYEGETDLRKAQLVMLRMLKIVDYICREHDINYWLDSGTLLGAARTGGFIPWDDDLDIAMPREDYERFLIIATDNLPVDLFLQTFDTDVNYRRYGSPCKVRDCHSLIEEKYSAGSNMYHHGIFIDIFPMDKMRCSFPGKWIDYFHKQLFKALYLYHYVLYEKGRGVKNVMKNMLSGLKSDINSEYLIEKYMKVLNKRMEKNKNLTSCFLYDYGFDLPFIKRYQPDYIFPLKEGVFEGSVFRIPNKIDQVLVTCYGPDYLIPKKTKNSSHVIKINIDTRNNR